MTLLFLVDHFLYSAATRRVKLEHAVGQLRQSVYVVVRSLLTLQNCESIRQEHQSEIQPCRGCGGCVANHRGHHLVNRQLITCPAYDKMDLRLESSKQ